jgi:ribosome-associated toxin RatA of RatAB toxin-antitoxin module
MIIMSMSESEDLKITSAQLAEDDDLEDGDELEDLFDDQDPLENASDIDVIIEKLEGRQRRITASILIPTSPEKIWEVLTQYEQLADFIPNLIESRIVGEEDGQKLIRQVGQQKFMLVKFSATVVLKMLEIFPRQLQFSQKKGDFKLFQGSWDLTPLPPSEEQPLQTRLTYSLLIHPPRHMPLQLIERRMRHDLGVNLLAICERACLP